MKGLGVPLLITAGGFLAYRLMQVTNAVQQLKISVGSVKHRTSNLTSTQFDVTLSVYNPNKVRVNFERIYSQVKVEGKLLGELDIAGAGTSIQPLGNTDIKVPLIINHLNAVGVVVPIISALINKRPITTPFEILGTLYAGGLQLPIAQTIKLSDYKLSGTDTNCFTCITNS